MSAIQKKFLWLTSGSFMVVVMAAITLLMLSASPASAQEHNSGAVETQQLSLSAADTKKGMSFIGAGIAFGLAALGAGIAVASVGAAALGVLSEKPNMLGQAFMFVALGEGIVILGFAMAFLIMGNAS